MDTTVIDRVTRAWTKKASVLRWQPTFEPSGPVLDYPLSILPVDQRALAGLDAETRQALSTSFWIQYNRRTIDAEEFIANPAIDWLTREGALPTELKTALMQTAVDERYHTYFHTLAVDEALARATVRPTFARAITVRELRARLDECIEPWQRDLVQLAYAAVAEVSVNAFLDLLSSSTEIRDANRSLVFMHNLDERLHSTIFVEIVDLFIEREPRHRSELLVAEIRRASQSFLEHDFSMYRSVFEAHGLDIAPDTTNKLMSRDMSGIVRLVGSLS